MALVAVRQYKVPFSTTIGESIEWLLEIWRTYDDADGTPSWINDPEIDLVGTGSPIEIEWERDYNVYKPILGSKANISLLVQNAGQYADFNDAGPFEYQIRLKYKDASDTLQDFWRGYMTPLDGLEAVTTFPFQVSYTATDGLGLLEQVVTRIPQGLNNVKAWDSVTEALYQTGLDLDIYLDSGIKTALTPPVTESNAIEAITEVSVDPAWIYKDDDLNERLTGKEVIEGVLSAFNCTIKQSYGKWYITNASSYGGTTDSVTFEVYNVVTNVYVKNATPATEQVRYTIDGTETQALVPVNQDLVLSTRRPYGSIECRPQGLFAESVKNGGFELVDENGIPLGWSSGPTEGPLQTSTDVHFEGDRSLVTEHNTFRIDNSINDTWFMNTEGIEVDGSGSFEVGFDWLGEILIDSGSEGIRNVHLNYEVFFVPDNNTFTGFLSGYDPTQFTVQQNSLVQAFFWNQTDNEWMPVLTTSIYGFYSNEALAEGGDLGQWLREDLMMPAVRYWDYASGDPAGVAAGPGKLYIRVYFPGGQKDNGLRNQFRGNGDGRLRVFVDNMSARNVFANEIDNPVFERLQDSYTTTYTYEPSLLSSGNDAIVQKVSSTEFIRTGVADDITTNKTLEEIGTQLKLNDFQSQFKYYEGNLVNLTGVPLSPHHKVLINWQGYTETESCIINGGRFDVKNNQFDIAMYVPHQRNITTGEYEDAAPGDGVITNGVLGPGFYPYNVDLEAMQFVGNSTKRTYRLDVVSNTTGDNGAVTDGLVGTQKSYLWVAEPGAMIPIELTLEPIVNNRAVATATTTADPAPTYLSDPIYSNNGVQLRVNTILTMQDHSAFETLTINGVITDATPENIPDLVNHTITFTHSIDNIATPSPFVINANGIPGDRKSIVYTINAQDNFFVENIDETHSDASLSNGVVTGNGTQAATIVFDYNVPGTAEDVPVTITGSTRPATGIDVDPITKTLTITNSVPNLTVIDGLSIPFVGIAGQKIQRNITCDPPADQYIDSLTTSSVSGDLVVGTPYVSGEDWEIPVEVEIVNDTNQPAFTIGGELKEEPYSVTFSIKAVGLDNANVYVEDTEGNRVLEHRETFDEGNFVPGNDDITPFIIVVEPTGNNVFTDPTDIITTINEGAVVVNGNEIVNLGEDAFTASPTLNTSTGVINVTIQGKFPTRGGQYVLATAIIGDTNAQGGVGVTETRATIGSLTQLTTLTPGEPQTPGSSRILAGISAAGGTAQFRLIADGTWEISEVEITLGGEGTMTSTTGSFTETYDTSDIDPSIQPPLTFSQSGSIGPLSGGAGEHLITLTVDAIGYDSRIDGTTPHLFIPQNWEINYIFRVIGVGPANAAGNPAALTFASAVQRGAYGTTNIVLPGFTDSQLMMASTDTGAENLIFFG